MTIRTNERTRILHDLLYRVSKNLLLDSMDPRHENKIISCLQRGYLVVKELAKKNHPITAQCVHLADGQNIHFRSLCQGLFQQIISFSHFFLPPHSVLAMPLSNSNFPLGQNLDLTLFLSTVIRSTLLICANKVQIEATE
jgi:hypothetical protein